MVIAIPLASLTSTISLSPLVSAEAASVPGVSDVVHPACLGGPGGGGRRHGSWGWLSRIRNQDGCNYSCGLRLGPGLLLWCDRSLAAVGLYPCLCAAFLPSPTLWTIETFCGVLATTGTRHPSINITTSRDGDTASHSGHGLHNNTSIPSSIRWKSETISMWMSSSSDKY